MNSQQDDKLHAECPPHHHHPEIEKVQKEQNIFCIFRGQNFPAAKLSLNNRVSVHREVYFSLS